MSDVAERLDTLRQTNGLSVRDLAALVDVAPSTISRIINGKADPAYSLALSLFEVLGEPLTPSPCADVWAIAAARIACSATTGSQIELEMPANADRWLERWERLKLVTNRAASQESRPRVLNLAGSLARLSRRKGSVDYELTESAETLAKVFADADIEYAVTGDAAANRYVESADETWPVVYVEDIDRAADAANLDRLPQNIYGPRLTLIPFDGVCEQGRVDIDGMIVTALDQVIIDCYAGTGRMPEQADYLVGARW